MRRRAAAVAPYLAIGGAGGILPASLCVGRGMAAVRRRVLGGGYRLTISASSWRAHLRPTAPAGDASAHNIRNGVVGRRWAWNDSVT